MFVAWLVSHGSVWWGSIPPIRGALVEFYTAITGWEVDRDDGEWVQLRSDGGATLAFQRAPGHRPPMWPSDDHPQQAHLDFDVPDLDVGEGQVLGARKADVQPGTSFRVSLDPAGHPFCLVLDEGTRERRSGATRGAAQQAQLTGTAPLRPPLTGSCRTDEHIGESE